MKHPNSRTRQKATRRPKAQPRRAANQAKQEDTPASHTSHTFPTSIQVVLDDTATLSMLVQEWLARGIQAFMQAVKHQWASKAVPPDRQLPPPHGPGDEDGHNERTLEVIPRSPRRRR